MRRCAFIAMIPHSEMEDDARKETSNHHTLVEYRLNKNESSPHNPRRDTYQEELNDDELSAVLNKGAANTQRTPADEQYGEIDRPID